MSDLDAHPERLAAIEEAEAVGARLGQQIRALRRDRGLTLAHLAETTGLSLGLVSQIERGLSEPSVKALHLLASALGVTVGWFFRDDGEREDTLPESDLIVRRGARRTIGYAGGIVDELLSPSLDGQLELLLCRIAPGSGADPYAHAGEEAGYVVAGTLELTVEGHTHVLTAGDSFGFRSMRPHSYRNPTRQETVVIWAVTPPSF
ncbi:putative transcriptional regulator [Novosphingobium nitrogenifigens DSM 19370]|uniref:Putative transcriptional regulator n=1 Tax=Novosphingobium nitrogenifigens DSM 19370 TaxID=983920 RepID=F1Z6G3_9SPHN|nr:cupin domain-containing protein [Novosphingobium nitrogenifigens]EGD59945.1 putative transcriptional regulator [Novosphingobium nitrogenifigens DSM 19370]